MAGPASQAAARSPDAASTQPPCPYGGPTASQMEAVKYDPGPWREGPFRSVGVGRGAVAGSAPPFEFGAANPSANRGAAASGGTATKEVLIADSLGLFICCAGSCPFFTRVGFACLPFDWPRAKRGAAAAARRALLFHTLRSFVPDAPPRPIFRAHSASVSRKNTRGTLSAAVISAIHYEDVFARRPGGASLGSGSGV